MIFVSPWVLVGLLALPVLWWLIRVTPPAPTSEIFPAVRFLLGLNATEETPARTPWWLLLLRLVAASLVIVALARPILDAGDALAGKGPVLVVMDNGWASAGDWVHRKEAVGALLDRAERAGRKAALLATASDGSGAPMAISATMPIADLRARLAALQPQAWPPDRAEAADLMKSWKDAAGASVIYMPDGLTDGADFNQFAAAMRAVGPVTEICCDAASSPLLLPPTSEADRLVVHLAQVPRAEAMQAAVLAESGDGRALARADVTIPAGASAASAPIKLPPELRNRLTRLVLDGPPSAGSVVLLDERWRRRPVGLLAGEMTSADTPFTGSIYFLKRALEPYTELRTGGAATLLKREISVLILADRPLPEGAERDALTAWVKKGGLLIRFAGPRTAESAGNDTDTLLPVRLLAGDRQLGGAMSWSKPAGLAPFPPQSPFAGLPVPDEVKVTRQVLAEPSAELASRTWATLQDGTPLVTEMPLGAGRVVLFHVTANADWSNLPLSGLFVEMLRHLVQLSVGVANTQSTAVLAPAATLDGFGLLTDPPPAAIGLQADKFGSTPASPRHPPGLYGPESGRRVLNLGTSMAAPEPAPVISGATLETIRGSARERALGPPLLALAVLLLCVDMLVSLALRGLLKARVSATAAALMLLMIPAAHALDSSPNPATETRLGYIVSGDAQVDGVAKAGLEGLSEYVNRRTAATLYEPDPVRPGETDLSFYPLLYWPITADAPALTDAQASALNDYMSRGGIILIDTRDSGSGAGFNPGTEDALRRISHNLIVPPLAPLTIEHVLSHSFYLLSDFPGRFTGDTVWVQRDQDRTNDSVSPVIIGGNDWAAAWAIGPDGNNPYAVIPGGQRQRTLAYRFGVNLVMYALTGNYKGDQVHVPAILQRLGQ
ncbi:DUF4159 domain-containing protein [Rhodopila globiformis]|uniref:DUF4159 domain-containing protein n=1 Tax=Rhodopila globiformis TaxID=1071 RepID=A0A2S6NNB7_RHOGL|nr:DUF4159 domain-containing protein [Rhodopila globiformis]PPQ38487.1 hypothetical protein CCS01_02200 [Rhodopila globiformis]